MKSGAVLTNKVEVPMEYEWRKLVLLRPGPSLRFMARRRRERLIRSFYAFLKKHHLREEMGFFLIREHFTEDGEYAIRAYGKGCK